MATRKPTPKKASSPSNENKMLTEEQVYDVLAYAQQAYGLYGNIYTPELVNARMRDISLSPQKATADKIDAALLDPKNNEQQLIGYSEYLELNSMLYKRILLYFSGLLSFDWNYVCTNIKEPKEYDSPAYKKDLLVVKDFFNKFNVKDAFRTALKQMLRTEAYFAVLRDDGEKYILQELPEQYSIITGRFDNGLLYDFNMMWFWQAGVSLDMYPNIFKKMFNKAFGGNPNPMQYNPAINIDNRSGSYVYWVQTSPKDGFTCFKLFPEIATRVPFLSPYMPDAVLQPVIRALQTDSYIAEASKIIIGQVEFLKDAGAKVKDALTLDPKTLGMFLALMKAGLPSAIKVAAAPLANMEGIQFDGNNDMYDSYLSTSASSSGINSRLIYSKDRQNVSETRLSMNIDENILRPVYAQFENILEYWINQRTKKYKFKFLFEGFENYLDKQDRFDKANKLAEKGIVLYQKFASAYGMNPFDFLAMLEETKAIDFVKNLTPILLSNQLSANANVSKTADGKGRPQKGDSELSDSGADTKADGNNDEKASE